MTDTVYLYPKTSCPCNNCASSYSGHVGRRMNVCDFSPYFDCYNRLELNRDIQPKKKKGYEVLNPRVVSDKFDTHFDLVKCPCPVNTCPDVVAMSRDPRQFNAMTAQTLALDTAPINGSVKLKDIYDEQYDDYGQGYKPYNKLKDGQIMYYVDRSIEDAFFKPVFSENAEEQTVMYSDPMGAMKPEYNRKALINTIDPLIREDQYPDCLSFIQDSQSYREDIMALQMRKQNQFRFSPLWSTQSN